MTRHRLNLRTQPLNRVERQTGSRARDGLGTRAFRAATDYPWDLRDGTPLCAGQDPELFWPATAEDAARAKAICRGCPLARSCLAVATERGEWGIWGGALLARGRSTDDLPGNVRPPSPAPARSA